MSLTGQNEDGNGSDDEQEEKESSRSWSSSYYRQTNVLPNITLQRMIDNLHVSCPNQLQEEEGKEDGDGDDRDDENHNKIYNDHQHQEGQQPPKKRQKVVAAAIEAEERTGSVERHGSNTTCCSNNNMNNKCTWTGSLSDWKNRHQCPLVQVSCPVQGCSYTCLRRDLDDHLMNDRLQHMHLLVKQETQTIKESILDEIKTKVLYSIWGCGSIFLFWMQNRHLLSTSTTM